MDDDIEGAEKTLNSGDSQFHVFGSAVVLFVKSVLGFEQDTLRLATEKLAEAESGSSDILRGVQKRKGFGHSTIFPAGEEHALCIAQTQIMLATVAIINGSVSGSLKGFYKMRRAYISLESMIKTEQDHHRSKETAGSRGSTPHPIDRPPKTSSEIPHRPPERDSGTQQDLDQKPDNIVDTSESPETFVITRPGSEPLGTTNNLFDDFIVSGSHLCFGILLVIISLIPPTFSWLLKALGISGDRQRGLAMLWRTSDFDNIHGAFAALILLGYYNTLSGLCDMIPEKGHAGYHREKFSQLLYRYRTKHSRSTLWVLEEARMLSSSKRPDRALELIKNAPQSPLKQIEAIRFFESSLNCLYEHRWQECADSVMQCLKFSDWSVSLNYYMAACSHVELYRLNKVKDSELSIKHQNKALEYFDKAMKHSGERSFLARPLPLDVFAGRKIRKWKQRSVEFGCSMIDAIGISPFEELIYFWNGYKKMRSEQLELSMERLLWCKSSGDDEGSAEQQSRWKIIPADEEAELEFLRAVVLRNLGRLEEAKQLMLEVMNYDPNSFKTDLKEHWILPMAHYETGVIYWNEIQELNKSNSSSMDDLQEKRADIVEKQSALLEKCRKYIEKFANWEPYELEARMSIRASSAQETIKSMPCAPPPR